MKSIILFFLFHLITFGVFPIQSFAKSQSLPIYYGVHVQSSPQDLTQLTQFESDAGKKASIVMWYQGWGVTDGTQNFQPAWMNNVRNHGSIPLITWEPWDYTQGVNQPTYSLQNIINGNFDTYITQWAIDSKTWGHPYFIRLAHEMNGNWYPWSEQVNGNTAGQYILAWRHVHDIFSNIGATNVTWMWSPNISYNGSIPMDQVYPGDSYVDWIALDGYNWGTSQSWTTWKSFSQIFDSSYTEITNLTQKPLMIAETASTEVGGNKSAWITKTLSSQIFSYPRIKGIVWFNENKETDWRIESSATSMQSFSQSISASQYRSNNYGHINSIDP